MPVSASLRQDGSQERPVSLTSSTSSSGSSRDSRGAMEEPSGSGASAENGAGSPRGRHPPNGNTSSSGWLSGRGPLSPFGGWSPAAPVHKLSYLGRVVREIVETERMYVQDLRSIVEVRPFMSMAAVPRLPWGWPSALGGPPLLGARFHPWRESSP